MAEPEPWDLVPREVGGDEEADDLAEAQASPPAATAAPRPSVTPEVAGILRAEAEREARARAEEEAGRQTLASSQPVSVVQAVPEVSTAPEPLREAPRMARLQERSLDLDKIDSSLRSTSDRLPRRPPQIEAPPPRRGGFARGFWGALLVLAVLAGLYVVAPTLMEAVPGLRVVLEPYVAAVNEGRLWLDRQMGAVLGNEASSG